jgi:hypothetical protein
MAPCPCCSAKAPACPAFCDALHVYNSFKWFCCRLGGSAPAAPRVPRNILKGPPPSASPPPSSTFLLFAAYNPITSHSGMSLKQKERENTKIQDALRQVQSSIFFIILPPRCFVLLPYKHLRLYLHSKRPLCCRESN